MSIRKRKWKTRNGFVREVWIHDTKDSAGKRTQRAVCPDVLENAAARAARDWFNLPKRYQTKERLLKMVAEAR